MKPIVFGEKWEDVMFILRNASKILLHFHTLIRLSDASSREISDFLHKFCDRIPEEDIQLIFGDSADIAAQLVELSNDVLNFYTDPGNEFVEKNEDEENKTKATYYRFIKVWCIPVGKLSDDEYNFFVKNAIKTKCGIDNTAYTVLKNLKYEEFLKTKYWMSISRFVREKSGKCEECGATTNLHVHHISYKNHGCEHAHLEDLVCLCKECHIKAHHEQNKTN